jgi:hypothetical protein
VTKRDEIPEKECKRHSLYLSLDT